MMTQEGPKEQTPQHIPPKGRSRPLIVIGVILLGAGAPLLGVAMWKHAEMEIKAEEDIEAQETQRILQSTPAHVLEKVQFTNDEIEALMRQGIKEDQAKRQRKWESAAAGALPVSCMAVICIVLGCVPFRLRLMTVAVLLLSTAAAVTAWAVAEKVFSRSSPYSENAAVCAFVIAVTGLTGLICAILGFGRIRHSTERT